jgi:hypothetical protein
VELKMRSTIRVRVLGFNFQLQDSVDKEDMLEH